jgi:hypothetical protein
MSECTNVPKCAGVQTVGVQGVVGVDVRVVGVVGVQVVDVRVVGVQVADVRGVGIYGVQGADVRVVDRVVRIIAARVPMNPALAEISHSKLFQGSVKSLTINVTRYLGGWAQNKSRKLSERHYSFRVKFLVLEIQSREFTL